MYCLEMVDKTGIMTVPGSGFGQQKGTYHFRITNLVNPTSHMEQVLENREAAGVVFVELMLVHGGGENSSQIAAGGEKDGVAPWCAKGGRERAGAAASPELADLCRDVPSCSHTDARASRSRSPRPAVPMATPLTQPRALWRAGVLR